MGAPPPMPPATLWVLPKPRRLTAPKRYFNPLLHFVKPEVDLISSEKPPVFGIEGAPRGSPQIPQRIGARISQEGSGEARGVPLMPRTEGFRS